MIDEPILHCQDCGAPLSEEHAQYMGEQCLECYLEDQELQDDCRDRT